MNENNTEKATENLPLEDHDPIDQRTEITAENDMTENSDTTFEHFEASFAQDTETAEDNAALDTAASAKSSPPSFFKSIGFICLCICVSIVICFALVVDKYNMQKTTVIYQNESWQNPGEEVTEDAIVNATAKASPSVVAITTEKISYTALGNYVVEGAGSGVICTEDGYIITNHHVISEATAITVTLENGKTHAATLIGADSTTDLAVIKINARGLCPAVYADADSIMVGQTVLAIGNPLGNLTNTVTNGIVSALARQIIVESSKMTLLQHNAAVSPGNSGGGLFNTNGELIGIVNAKSAKEGVEGIGFAIPLQTVKKVVNELIESGAATSKVQLGITGYEILYYQQIYSVQNEDVVNAFNNLQRAGVYINSHDNVNYAKGSEKLQTGDYLSAIDGQLVNEFNDISLYLMEKDPGQTVTLTVYRYNLETKKTMQIHVSIILTEKKQ